MHITRADNKIMGNVDGVRVITIHFRLGKWVASQMTNPMYGDSNVEILDILDVQREALQMAVNYPNNETIKERGTIPAQMGSSAYFAGKNWEDD